MAPLYKKAPREQPQVRCAYPGYGILGARAIPAVHGNTKTNGEPKLAV